MSYLRRLLGMRDPEADLDAELRDHVGLVTAFLLSGMLRSFVHSISPTDPATYLWIGALMVAAALAAGIPAALRIRHVSPAETLRAE